MGKARFSLSVLFLVCAVPLAAQTKVPTPAEFLGFEPGTDRKLADYDQVYGYFQKLAATTDRVRFSSIGRTTENHELGLAIISSAKNLANLDEIRKTNLALVDPRKLKPGESVGLIARGKTIVCLNASIHSVEVGPTQATLPLAYFLATTQDPEWLGVLDDVVLLMLPCHNPDGYLKIVDWYRKWVGTPYESCPFPGLYHTYAGHDNNRDWFMFNLQETRLTVKQIYLPWVPQIVMDMHQMKEDGPRMFMPPYQDPIEPNVDPILIDQLNDLGLSVQKGLIAKGMTGIVNRTLFDGWSPSRAYMHYHGGVRFLCEIASCRQATPIERKGLAHGAASRSSTNPAPWNGDRWALSDIIRYHNEAALGVLKHASKNRERWLTRFHEVFEQACEPGDGLAAFVVPIRQSRGKIEKLMDILDLAGIECADAHGGIHISAGDVTYGDIVIPSRQPFFAFARALLTNVPYPEIREKPNDPVRRPYDATAHCLSLLLNLSIMRSQVDIPSTPLASPRRAVELGAEFGPSNPGDISSQGRWDNDLPRQFLTTPTFFFDILPVRGDVAVYRPFITNVTDEGWTRHLLREFNVRPISLNNYDFGLLTETRPTATRREPIRVLILPSLTADQILNGTQGADVPPDYRGGIGERGAAQIDRFVREGGTLIALKDSTALPIQIFKLPIRNALLNLPEGRHLDIPGAILSLKVLGDESSSTSIPAFFDGGKAFELDPSPERDHTLIPAVKAQWAPAESLRLAGYAEGLDLLAGRAAIIECTIGRGRVVLFGFSPQFRGQSWSTFRLLLDAVKDGLRN